MKRTLVFAAAMAIAGLAGSSAIAGPALGKELLDLESHIKWNAVEGAWKSLRDGWVRATATCEGAACVAAQLITLEENGKWGTVDNEWKVRRSGWVRDCHAATSNHDV